MALEGRGRQGYANQGHWERAANMWEENASKRKCTYKPMNQVFKEEKNNKLSRLCLLEF